jgi:chemotaxis protein CheC
VLNSLDELNTFHLEVFQEIGNIGAGNAATALANLINKKIDMDVPKAGIVEFSDLMALVGNEEDSVICVRQAVTG